MLITIGGGSSGVRGRRIVRVYWFGGFSLPSPYPFISLFLFCFVLLGEVFGMEGRRRRGLTAI